MTDLYVPPVDFKTEFAQGGVKAAIAESGAKARDLLMVPLDKIKIVAGLNVRIHDAEYEAHVEEIKNSIIHNGFYQHFPLSGYAGKEDTNTFIYLTGGFTRFEAAKRALAAGAPIEALPVVLKPPGTSMIDLTLALDVDNTGAPLRPYERAIVIKRLIGYGAEEETIRQRMGITEQYMKDLLYLMSLPKSLQSMVTSGKAAAGHVVQVARKIGPTDALKAFENSVPSEGSDAPASSSPARVTPRSTAAATAKGPIIPKKTLFNAIDYAIALPGDGIKWLSAWRQGEKEATAELASYKPPRKPRKDKKADAKTTTVKGKGGRKPKAKGGSDDPVFSTKSNGAAAPAGDDAPL